MRSKPTPAVHLVLPLCLCLLAGCAASAGRQEAREDLKRNHHELRIYGEMYPWDGDYAELLQSSADVRFRRVAGCVITSEARAEADGYNDVMTASIEQAHGPGYLDELMDQAQARYRARQAAAVPD